MLEEAPAEEAAAAADESVDARSLMQAEIARLRMEQAQAETPAAAAEEAPAAAAPEAPAEPKPASKRFVVDLRTGSR